MAAPRLLWRNWADEATLTASSAGYGASVTNLQTTQLGVVWLTGTSTAAETVVADLGSAKAVQGFALLGHDLVAGDSLLKIQGHTADSWGSPAFSQDITWRAGSLLEVFSAAQTYRYWRLCFTKTSAGVARQAGRLYLGPAYTCPLMTAGDFRIGLDDGSSVRRTAGGQLWSDEQARLRTLRCGWRHASEAFRTELQALALWGGASKPWVFAGDPTTYPVEWSLYGTLSGSFEARYDRWTGADPLWDLGLEMTEAL